MKVARATPLTHGQAAIISKWLIVIVTAVLIVVHGVAAGTFVLPFTLTKAELAWLILALPVLDVVLSYVIRGLSTGDWSPPDISVILKLFGHPAGVPEPSTPTPITNPPAPAVITLFQDRVLSLQPIAPATLTDPPRPVYSP